MIKFRNQGSSAKAKASKKVVVEVKHPRKLNKANSIWGGIDLAKHSHDVEQHLPTASETEKAADQKFGSGLNNEKSVADKLPVVRVLEDRKQAAEIEAGKQAALNFDPESDLFMDEKAHMQRSDAYMQRLDGSRLLADKEVPDAEVVGSLKTEEAVVADAVQLSDAAEDNTHQESIEFDSDVSGVDPVSEHSSRLDDSDDSFEDETSVEMSSTEGVAEDEAPSPTESYSEDDVDDNVASNRPLKALSIRFSQKTRTKKIPGIRYVRRNGELQIARGDKWKVPRIVKSSRV